MFWNWTYIYIGISFVRHNMSYDCIFKDYWFDEQKLKATLFWVFIWTTIWFYFSEMICYVLSISSKFQRNMISSTYSGAKLGRTKRIHSNHFQRYIIYRWLKLFLNFLNISYFTFFTHSKNKNKLEIKYRTTPFWFHP